jgi:hypothetical protein
MSRCSSGLRLLRRCRVIASEAKQSIGPQSKLDCFVASAPRNDEPTAYSVLPRKIIERPIQRLAAGLLGRPIGTIAGACNLDARGLAAAPYLPAEAIGPITAAADDDGSVTPGCPASMTSTVAASWTNTGKRRCNWRAQCLRNAGILMGKTTIGAKHAPIGFSDSQKAA